MWEGFSIFDATYCPIQDSSGVGSHPGEFLEGPPMETEILNRLGITQRVRVHPLETVDPAVRRIVEG